MKRKFKLKNPEKWRKILSKKNILLKEFAQECKLYPEQVSRIFSLKNPQRVGEVLRRVIQYKLSQILKREIPFSEIWEEIKE